MLLFIILKRNYFHPQKVNLIIKNANIIPGPANVISNDFVIDPTKSRTSAGKKIKRPIISIFILNPMERVEATPNDRR